MKDLFLMSNTRLQPRLAAFVVVGIAIGALLVAGWFDYLDWKAAFNTVDEVPAEETASTTQIVGDILPESAPVRLRIPKIGVDTTFEAPLGVDENQEIEVPDSYEEVGWYKYGPTPGELGPAIILGHVDSVDGAAVFYLLGQLEEGDRVFVDREDGSTAEFEVTAYERPSQSEFPTNRVYGNIDHAGLRLITCTGTFDHGVQRYSHNLIVYARLVSDSE